ncbi:hypothetical protein C3F09_04195 [candidate division GN15 bacterium]|uniref:Uncharacterized protein n=1 Tax=candidate division GN15 bacterium TaxID=2072418 RepID=A0A855XA48_9BACT|nr:MAG: hypothetical protein C3F09_04195 [candidate division GN15 bacterium]
MKKNLYLLAGIIALYLGSSLVLQAIYGPSFGFLASEDSWVADQSGGWVRHGNPTSPMPAEPSVNVPIGVRYIPIFLPAALLILFYLTPLSRKIESPPLSQRQSEGETGEPPAENGRPDRQ